MTRSPFKKFVLALCALSILFTLNDDAEARRRRRHRRSRGRKKAVINEPTLYERMGGSKVVAQLVDEWVRNALADGRLSGAWGGSPTPKPESVTALRKNLNSQLCELADGPCKTAKNEAAALDDEKFVIFADHLVVAMDKNRVREREKNEMLGRLGNAHDDTKDEAAE